MKFDPKAPSGYTVRHFRQQDLEALMDLEPIPAGYRREWKAAVASHLDDLSRRPGYSLESNLLLAFLDGAAVGYCDIWPELAIGRVVLEFLVRPFDRHREATAGLLDAALREADALGAGRIHVCMSEGRRDERRFFEQAGFRRVRVFEDLCLDLDRLPAERPVSADIAAGVFRPDDEQRLAQLQNAVFADTWGYCPNTTADIRYYLNLTGCRPEDILTVREGRRPVGFLWPHRLYGTNSASSGIAGRIHMFGIRPDRRNRGYGYALLRQGLVRLRDIGWSNVELTVDGDNRAASGLYERMGFRLREKKIWFEK